MTAAVFLSYWTGLRFVAPDLDPAALVGTALALHVHAATRRASARMALTGVVNGMTTRQRGAVGV